MITAQIVAVSILPLLTNLDADLLWKLWFLMADLLEKIFPLMDKDKYY